MSIGFQVRATIANLAFGIGTTSIMKVERHAIAWVAYLLRSRYMKTSGQGRTRHKNDPWEVLVVAGLFFFPGLFMLFQRGTRVAFQQSFYHAPSGFTVLSEHGAHIFGMLAILVGLALVWFISICVERSPAMKGHRSHAGDDLTPTV